MGSRFVRRHRALIAVALLLCPVARVARAGGIEYTGQGVQSLARGGAVAARASDPMVLAHNPAGLAELRGTQLLVDFNLARMKACVDPYGYYGWGAYLGGRPSRLPDPSDDAQHLLIPLSVIDNSGPTPTTAANDYYTDPYDTVCLGQNMTPIPQLAFTKRVTENLGIGVGLIFPSAQPTGAWGAPGTGVIRGDTGELRPAPTRYQLLSASNLGLFPNVGLGYRVARQLRVGASLEYGFVYVNNHTMAPATGGTSPHNDVVAHIRGTDYVVPAFTVSAHVVPIDALDVVLAFRWQDDVEAHGRADFTSGVFDPDSLPHTTRGVGVPLIRQRMPWKLRGGIRFADRRVPRARGTGNGDDLDGHRAVHDAMQDERWDIELDAEYQFNSRNDAQLIDFTDGSRVQFRAASPGHAMTDFELPSRVTIQKQWRDQISVRLGGSANLVPGILSVSAGAHYETRGVTPAYMQVDFWPVARVGLHGGVTLRVTNSVDFTLAYAHIFQETMIVAPPAHRERTEIEVNAAQASAIDKTVGAPTDRFGAGLHVLHEPAVAHPDGVARLTQTSATVAPDQPNYITNAGRYRSSIDVLAVGMNLHF